MKIYCTTDKEHEDYTAFNTALRQSGIYVDPDSMSGGGPDGIEHMIYGDEEAIEYYYQLWQDGKHDPLLGSYIKRGIEKQEYICDLLRSGNTGVQG